MYIGVNVNSLDLYCISAVVHNIIIYIYVIFCHVAPPRPHAYKRVALGFKRPRRPTNAFGFIHLRANNNVINY